MSKIKILEVNKVLVEESNGIFEKILTMQSEADSQIRDIRSFEKKIIEIQKKKQIEATLLSEKIAMEKIIETQKAEEASKEKAEVAVLSAVKAEAVVKKSIPNEAPLIQEKEKATVPPEIVQVKATEAKPAEKEPEAVKAIPKAVSEEPKIAEFAAQKPETAEPVKSEDPVVSRNLETQSNAATPPPRRENVPSGGQESRSFNGYNANTDSRQQQNRPEYQNRDNQGQGQGQYGQNRPPFNRDNQGQGQGQYSGQNRPPYQGQGQQGQGQYGQNRPPYQGQGQQGQGQYSGQNRPPFNRDNQGQGQGSYAGQNRPPYQGQGQGQGQGQYGQNRPPYQGQGQGQGQGQYGQNRPPYQGQGQGQGQGQRPPFNSNGPGGPSSGQNRPPYNNNRPSFNPYPRKDDFGKDKDADADHPAKRSAPRGSTAPKVPSELAPVIEKSKVYDSKKFKKPTADESKQKAAKRNTIKEHVISGDDDDYMRRRRRRKQEKIVFEPIVIEKAIITSDTLSVKLFAEKIGKPVSEILKKLLLLGMICTINSQIDYDTASLIASEFKIELEKRVEQTAEQALTSSADLELDAPEDLIKRPPIVTIMGHVDHGKTSLLDKIRSTKVTESEAGGITQHIGAYQIEVNGNQITFIDTPGHEAFTAMRARGAQVTDVAILVVAADDGVMPQTIEAINHAKSAHVPIIVAINKIDKDGANPEKIKQALTEYELVAEEWGGDTVMVPVSATTGEGIDNLLDMITLVSEVQELKANPNRLAMGTIVEAKLDKGRGPVATVLIQNGTLHVQDAIVAGTVIGRVRAMVDDNGKNVLEAGPSKPVEVVGFAEVPEAGDILYAVHQDKLSKQVVEERKDKQKEDMLKKMTKVSLDDLFTQIAEGQIKELGIIIKGDVQGSVEAVKQSLEKLSNEQVRVVAIHCGVGAIKESDVMLASASNAIIIGFNVRPEGKAKIAAEHEKVDIRLYRIIYKAIEDIQNAMTGMLDPEFEEVILGHVEVRQIFKVSSVGTIAGCYVTDGKATRNAMFRLLRDNIVVHEGKISSLKRFKDDAKEVASGYECGISLENYNDIREADVLECFIIKEKER